jgi:hypothetical protein
MSKVVAGLGLAAFVAIAALFAPPRGDIILPSATPFVAPTSSASSAASAAPVPIPPGYRIQIPRLGIDLPIAEGDVGRDTVQQQTPENYAFHLPGTAIPGTGANSYLYAHARRGMPPGDVSWTAPSPPDRLTLQTSTGPNPGDPRFVVIAQPS